MYETKEAFQAHAEQCGRAHYPDGSLDQGKIDAAYLIYQQARKGTKLEDHDGRTIDFGVSIVGRLSKDRNGNWVPSTETEPGIDPVMRENLKTLNEWSSKPGSILDTRSWSLLANDAWLLGGLHAGTEFHFASPLKLGNLWDGSARRMTVTAREAIGIWTSGYGFVETKFEAVAVRRNDPSESQAASLLSYKSEVEQYASEEGIGRFWRSLPPVVKR